MSDQKKSSVAKLATYFLNSKLTLLGIILSLLLGVFAIKMTPKEEEPQIKVPMIDVMIAVPGYSPKEIEKRVTSLVERELSSLLQIDHVYSTSFENGALITVRFKVGEDLESSLVKIHDKMMGLKERLPKEMRSQNIKSYTIDDVPFYTLTFFSALYSSSKLREKLVPVAKSLQEIEGISEMEIKGGERKVVKVIPNLKKLEELGISLIEIKNSIENANIATYIGPIRERSKEPIAVAGPFIEKVSDLQPIPVGRRWGRTIKLSEVATLKLDYDHQKSSVFYGKELYSAITVTFTKKKGVNATDLAVKLGEKLDLEVKKLTFDSAIKYEVSRNYGQTAKEKSDELLEHLAIATFSVMILIAIGLGFRVSLVVGIAVPVTLAMTLFIYYLLGYTLNRVTLFALIFSIGILVDDAIVVVENIYRHLLLKKQSSGPSTSSEIDKVIILATEEVGNPTILATIMVIVAIMPMAFVGGLMGPYMRPIPVGASLAMIFSLFIALIITPWASKRFIKISVSDKDSHGHSGNFAKFGEKAIGWVISKKSHTALVFGVVIVLLISSLSLVAFKKVKVKMLPFDNKSEFQLLVDLPPGTTLEKSKVVASQFVQKIYSYPEIKSVTTYIGTSAPFNFSGMVKHLFLREGSYKIDFQVNLIPKGMRKEEGHPFVVKLRKEMALWLKEEPSIDLNKDLIKLKFIEIPPGPPVMSTLLGEVYDRRGDLKESEILEDLQNKYKQTSGVVDIDTSIPLPQQKENFIFNRDKGGVYGVSEAAAVNTLLMALAELNFFSVHFQEEEEDVFMRLSLESSVKKSNKEILSLLVPSMEGDRVPLNKVFDVRSDDFTAPPIFHKDLHPVSYVMAEVAGEEESPFYAILEMKERLKDYFVTFGNEKSFGELGPQASNVKAILKFDGEMDITLEVFRDLGLSFFIAILFIMVLIIGEYNSFVLPFVIILPIPLTLIGIIPGHYFMNSFFSATSMIGFIAGAGITVRNSIILVDFIQMKVKEGQPLKQAAIEATIVRFRPIMLTALAVLVAGAVILFDPIFQGLAISLICGSFISALLSIPLVPVLFYWIKKGDYK